MYKLNHDELISAILYVEFPQVLYIDLSEIVQFVKADISVLSVHLRVINPFVVSHVLSTKVSSV